MGVIERFKIAKVVKSVYGGRPNAGANYTWVRKIRHFHPVSCYVCEIAQDRDTVTTKY